MSNFIIHVLQGTPVWVWAVLALIVWRGVGRLRTQDRALGQLAILPALFLLWGLAGLWQQAGAPAALLMWLAAASAGGTVGLRAANRLEIHHGKVRQPGSIVPLLFLLGIFTAKYALTVASVVDHAHALEWQQLGVAVSGACGGYFAAWWLRLVQRNLQATPALA